MVPGMATTDVTRAISATWFWFSEIPLIDDRVQPEALTILLNPIRLNARGCPDRGRQVLTREYFKNRGPTETKWD